MNRAKIEDALFKIGIPCGIKGFTYIVDAIQIFEERGTNIGITRELYPAIAEKRNTASTSVERAIRHAFGVARNKRDKEVIEHYIGFVNRANSSSLKQLYIMIKREEEQTCQQ